MLYPFVFIQKKLATQKAMALVCVVYSEQVQTSICAELYSVRKHCLHDRILPVVPTLEEISHSTLHPINLYNLHGMYPPKKIYSLQYSILYIYIYIYIYNIYSILRLLCLCTFLETCKNLTIIFFAYLQNKFLYYYILYTSF